MHAHEAAQGRLSVASLMRSAGSLTCSAVVDGDCKKGDARGCRADTYVKRARVLTRFAMLHVATLCCASLRCSILCSLWCAVQHCHACVLYALDGDLCFFADEEVLET